MGAGASAAVGSADDGAPLVPAVVGLTVGCQNAVSALGEWASTAWDIMRESLAKQLGLPDSSQVYIEDLLTNLREKLSSMSEGDTSAGATLDQLRQIEDAITREIVRAASPDDDRVPSHLPHDSLAKWIARIDRSSPVEIYTTNYDLLIERALEAESVPYFDGFVGSSAPFFLPSSLVHAEFAPGRRVTRLWKIHGSVNWDLVDEPAGGKRVVRRPSIGASQMILPSSLKYDQSRKLPYIAMLDRLSRALSDREDALVVAIGCGFGDQHVNEILSDALSTRPRMHLIALQFQDPVQGDALWKLASAHENVLAYGPTVAIVGSRPGTWRLIEPATNVTAPNVDLVFDSDSVPEAGEEELIGRFRLGDFNWFARFLDQMMVGRE
ncbi:SIR2 family protein [Agromyces sp. NPDC004153]